MFAHRAPGLTTEVIDAVYFGAHPDVPPYVHEDWHDNAEITERMGAWMGGVVMTTDLPELRDDRDRAADIRSKRPNLSTLSDGELVERARSLMPDIRTMFRRHLAVTAGSSIFPPATSASTASIVRP